MEPAHETLPRKGPCAELASFVRAAIPVLTTERLRLRAPEVRDFPLHVEIVNGPRGIGLGGPFDREFAWYDFAHLSATWSLRGHGWWTITARDSGLALGFAGIGLEPGDFEPELGYYLSDTAEGRGIAFEACQRILDFAAVQAGFETLVSYIDKDNERSIALAERLGATRDAKAEQLKDGQISTTCIYRHRLKRSAA